MNWYTVIFLMGYVGSLRAAYSMKPSYGGYGNSQTNPPATNQSLGCLLGTEMVCGTNGYENFLFENQCEFNDFNGRQLLAGQLVLDKTSLDFCNPSSFDPNYNPPSFNSYCPQYCNLIFKPVCGSYKNVQRNFTNECELRKYMCEKKENWQLILNSTCVDASCSMDGQEVCASFNNYRQHFPNLRSLYDEIRTTGKNWQILNVGPCPCPTDYRPICATLNCTTKTFQNECFLQQEIKTASYWSILFFGECPIIPTMPPCNGNGNASDTTATTPTTTPTTPSTTSSESPTTVAPNGNETTNDNSDSSDPAKAITTPTTPPTTPTTTTPSTTTTAGGTGNTTTTPKPDCNSPTNSTSVVYNRPVYIVKHNQIIPYGPLSYRPSPYGLHSYGLGNSPTWLNSYGFGGTAGQYNPSYSGSPHQPQIPAYGGSANKPYQSPGQSAYNPTGPQYNSSYNSYFPKPTQSPSYHIPSSRPNYYYVYSNVYNNSASVYPKPSQAPGYQVSTTRPNYYKFYSNANKPTQSPSSYVTAGSGASSGCDGSYSENKPDNSNSYNNVGYYRPHSYAGNNGYSNTNNNNYKNSSSYNKPIQSPSYHVGPNNVPDSKPPSYSQPKNDYPASNSYTNNNGYSNNNNNSSNNKPEQYPSYPINPNNVEVSKPSTGYEGRYSPPKPSDYPRPYSYTNDNGYSNENNNHSSSIYYNKPVQSPSYPDKVPDSPSSSGYGNSYSQYKPSNSYHHQRPNSYKSSNVYSNSNSNNGYHRPSSTYTKSNYKSPYSSKYNPITTGGNNDNDRSYEYDASYESFT